MKSKSYDFNVYVVDGEVRLSAYEVKYLDNPENAVPVETNTSNYHTLVIPMTMAHYGEVAYLVEDPKWHTADDDAVYRMIDTDKPTELERRAVAIDNWQDYDAWVGGDEWYDGLPTQRLKDWVDGLPEYEPELAHEWVGSDEAWNTLKTATELPATATVKCANCEETYSIGKSW
jgi:hypothetical protein